MMKVVASLALLVTLAAADLAPVPGDVGTVEHCIPSGEEGDECESCFQEREAEEGEEGEEKNAIESPTQECLDKCSHGYRITQLNNSVDANGIAYRNIALEPTLSCIEGCHCPTATGIFAEPEVNDENGAEVEEVYTLSFADKVGNKDAGYLEGSVTITYADGDGVEAANQVAMAVTYNSIEKKIDGDGNVEERIEKQECTVKYFISSGKVGGIAGKSSAVVPAAEQHSGELSGLIAMVEDTVPVNNCTARDFAEGSTDMCMYQCAQAYQVNTVNNSMVLVPKRSFISANCLCHFGIGFQEGSGVDFDRAMISFAPDSTSMCSSTFAGNLSELNQATTTEGNFAPITMSMTTSAGKYCTYSYEIGSGDVLGLGPSADEESNYKGRTIAAVLVSVFFLFAFFVPSCMPAKKRTYNAVP